MNKTLRKIISSMGTINEITLNIEEEKIEKARSVMNDIENYLLEIDDKFSIFKKNSEISLINNNAGIKETKVSKDTFEIIKLSKEYGILTNGAFDITIYPLSTLWKESIKNKKVPQNFNTYLRNVNYNDIILNEDKQSVMLLNKGQSIDLGGISKGYILDKVKQKLIENNLHNVLINLGGTISSIGEKRKIGIRNPFTSVKKNNSKSFAEINLINEDIVTSGIYEQCFEKDGKIFHHIISPFSGKPTDTDIISVTLIGNEGAKLDAIATSIFVQGANKGRDLLQSEKIKGIFVLKNGNAWITENLKNKVKLI